MPIHGSLDEAPVADVVQLLSLGQKTGCLALTDGTLRGEIYLDAGRVCQATVFNRRDRLGDLLVRSGKITRQQLEEAITEHRASGARRVSKILVESGQVARTELQQFVRVGVEEAVYFMFSWRNGSFTFTNNVQPENRDFLVSIDPQELLLEGARRVDEWSLIKKKIPRFDMVFRIDRARLNGAAVNLTDEQQRIVPLIDGSRDCTAIVETTGLSEFEVGKALFGLITAGFAFLVERRAVQRHLDYQELLAYVVREARFADAEHRKAAARHIADCATCTARLKSIHVRRTGSTAALPAIETDARAQGETTAQVMAKQPAKPAHRPEQGAAAPPQEPVVPRASTPVASAPASQPTRAEEARPPEQDTEWPDVERRVHLDRRTHERRSGGERRRAVSRNWVAGGRVERRSGRERRGAYRRGPERRAWVPASGGGASAVASTLSSTAHPATRRSLPDRRTTGPRRVPTPDRRSGVSPQPQRVITRERRAATRTPEPTETPPVAEPTVAKPAAARPTPEQAAETISEPTVATPAEESTPATLSEPAEARPVAEEAQQEVAEVPEAAPEADDLVTQDLATEQQLLAQDAAPAPAPEASATPAGEQPVRKRDEELIVSAADAMAESVAEPDADSEVAAEDAAADEADEDEEELEPEEVESSEEPEAPSKSREFNWLVSPDEADRMVRTSWVELQTPRRSGGRRSSGRAARRAVPERHEAPPPRREPPPPAVQAPVARAAVEPTAAPRMQPKPVAPETPRRSSTRARWIATAAAVVVLVGAGLLARPLLERQPTPVNDAVATSAPSPPVQQPPAQPEPEAGPPAREAQPVVPPSSEAAQPAATPPPTRTEAPTRTEPPPARAQPPETPVEKPPPAAAQETPPATATRDSAVQVGPKLPRTVSAPAEPAPAATTTIRGSVRAAGTGAPLAGAVVTIAGKELTATTDQTGSYTIADVPVGAATVEVTMSGRPAGQQEVVATAGAEATADFSVSAIVTAAQPDDGLGSGEWETADAAAAAEQLGGFIAVIPGLWVESVASPSAGSRRRARVAQLTGTGERIVLTETRSGAPGLGGGTPRVTALRVIGPTEAYPVTTGTASFGSLLVTAKTTLAPDSLRALLAKLSPLVPSR